MNGTKSDPKICILPSCQFSPFRGQRSTRYSSQNVPMRRETAIPRQVKPVHREQRSGTEGLPLIEGLPLMGTVACLIFG